MIFVTDMERAIDKLTALDKKLLFMNVLEEYYIPDMARLLSCNERTVRRGLQNALDNLSELLLAGEMMGEIGCQEGKNYKRGVSRSKEGENKRNYHLHCLSIVFARTGSSCPGGYVSGIGGISKSGVNFFITAAVVALRASSSPCFPLRIGT